MCDVLVAPCRGGRGNVCFRSVPPRGLAGHRVAPIDDLWMDVFRTAPVRREQPDRPDSVLRGEATQCCQNIAVG